MVKYIGFVGTYTQKKSEGIYSFTFDTDLKELSEVKLVAKLDKPSYLAISPNNNFLYSVKKNEEQGGVCTFSLTESGNKLQLLNEHFSEGAPPCHVSVSNNQKFLFTSNYHKGTVDSFLLSDDGMNLSHSSTIQHHGSGPDRRQEKAHTHYAGMTPDERYAIAIDLGADKIYTYTVDETGKLAEVQSLSVKPGSGPRHIVFHPSLKYAFVICEISSEIIVLKYNSTTGYFSEKQYVSTIPEDFADNNQGSAIHISSDGHFLYAGNRGHNSIAVFEVNEKNGMANLIDYVPTMGNWPRDFTLDPSEKYLIASNQESDNLVLFSRDIAKGTLQLIQDDIYVPEPVCVKFLHD